MSFRLALAYLTACGVVTAQVITTVAGTDWTFPATSLSAANAPLGPTVGVAVDGSGNVYVADAGNQRIFRIAISGTFTVVAGNGICGYSGDGGPATSAMLCLEGAIRGSGSSIALDSAGNLYIADTFNNCIRKVSGGIITTIAGSGGSQGYGFSGDGGPATSASLYFPSGVAVDSSGTLYIADQNNQRIRKVSGGIITTIAGNGTAGFSGDGGPATAASLYFPFDVAVDLAGSVYIADCINSRVRKVSGGTITTVAGNGTSGFSGDNGPATSAELNPEGVSVDSAGSLYIADPNNQRIRKVSAGVITTVAGNGTHGFSGDGGSAIAAALGYPERVTVDSLGNLYIADSGNYRIRKVSGGLITTLAGNGAYSFSGDDGPATSASLNGPVDVGVDSAGNIYIADCDNNRIRKVSAGIIMTVAGNGTAGFSGDGGPSTSAELDCPGGVAVDPSGNIYIADYSNYRIRKVSGGIITTIAGNGTPGFSGDGGPATSAEIWADGVTVDSAGNLYIADETNRIRKVSGGIITTVVGNGTAGFSGDGGPAVGASLNFPTGVVVDSVGNLYIADSLNYRIRKVSSGIITTVVGNGTNGFSGDGGPATSAEISEPGGVAVDAAGSLYIGDYNPQDEFRNNRIRKVSAGVITTVAGNGDEGLSGDGGLATSAKLAPYNVAVDSGGNLYVADVLDDRIREILAQPPTLQLSTASISLAASSGGKPATAAITVATSTVNANSIALPAMTYTVQVSSGGSWLSTSPQGGNTPGLITISADPSSLSPGTYSGMITVSVPLANPSTASVNVQFTVSAATAGNLSVDHDHLSFTYSNTSTARAQTITVSNSGGGSLPFTVSIAPNPGQSASWLSVTPTSASATPAAPAVLSVQADPTNLAAGTYSANIVISSAAGSATVSVVMTIGTNPLIMLLSQTGLTFTAVQNGGVVPPQTFSVLSLGSGTIDWSVQTSVLGGVSNWLLATPENGSSTPSASSTVTVSVNPNGLTPGVYYGLVTITSPGAANTPQGVVAVLQVLAAGTDVAPVLQPTSLNFSSAAGDSSPGSQNIYVYDPTGTSKSFRSGIVTANGGNWLVTLPTDATIPPNGPVDVVVQPLVNNLAPGTYQGTLALQFSDGRVSSIPVQFVVTAATGASTNATPALRPFDTGSACTSNQLTPSLTTLGSGFSVPAGYPQGLEAQVFDNCGNPQTDGTVFVQFSNGDPPVKLQSLGNGVWDGTWPVGATPTSVTLTVLAQSASMLKGQYQINGGLTTGMPSPMVSTGGVVSTASFAAGQPVAPGELISIFGVQLAGGQSPAGTATLPIVLAGTEVAIGSQTGPSAGIFQALPLYYASTGLVNAVVPYEASPNTNQQILLQWGTAYAPPVYVDVAPSAPGIFTVADLSGNVIGPNNPATAGQVVVIYCTGLGAVSPAVVDGVGSPGAANVQNPVTVSFGGQTISNPIYAGLTPGVAGLYQINITVPQGIAPGDSVPVSVIAANQASNQVVTSVR